MKIHNVEQGTEAWAKLRRAIPTASSADRLVTAVKGEPSKAMRDYACELLAAEMLPIEYWYASEDFRTFQSEAMAHGTNTEREARDYFALETGLEVQQVGFVTTDCGRAGCSPDGIVGDNALLELKCPQPKTHVRYLLDACLPSEYKPQVHFSMVVTGFDHAHFMSYAPGLPPFRIFVPRDDYTSKVESALQEFWAMLDTFRKQLSGLAVVGDYAMFADDDPLKGFKAASPEDRIVDDEVVKFWRITIQHCDTPAKLGKLRSEYREPASGMSRATKAAIDVLFDEQEEKIVSVPH